MFCGSRTFVWNICTYVIHIYIYVYIKKRLRFVLQQTCAHINEMRRCLDARVTRRHHHGHGTRLPRVRSAAIALYMWCSATTSSSSPPNTHIKVAPAYYRHTHTHTGPPVEQQQQNTYEHQTVSDIVLCIFQYVCVGCECELFHAKCELRLIFRVFPQVVGRRWAGVCEYVYAPFFVSVSQRRTAVDCVLLLSFEFAPCPSGRLSKACIHSD